MIFWEDFEAGQTGELGPRTVTREEILSFGREYDPQLFHVDEEAARASPFGGLIASGWQTAGICQRLVVDGLLKNVASQGSPGLEGLRWLWPVRPGDALTVRYLIAEKLPSLSKPELRGRVRLHYEVFNQHGKTVMTMDCYGIIGRRPT